jgi:hypothetical protein
MSFKIGHNLNLTFHQLLNARLQNLAGEPTGLGAGDKGRFFFDTTSGQDCLKVWNGAAFTRLRDDWISGVSPAVGSPLTVAGAQALSLDIALATGSFLVGDGNSKARALAKSSIAISGFAAAAAAVDLGSQRITNLADPVNPGDAANKAYVDATEQGLQPKVACRVATTAALPAHQFGANIMLADANGALPAIDGVTLQVGDRVLVKNEGSGTHLENGIYTVTALGDASNKWSFTRAGDADTSGEVTTGMYVLISEGTTWKGSGWFLQTAAPITLNTTAVTFVQFSAAGSFTAERGMASIGTGLYFAQTSAYTANTIPYATGESTIGFIGINSTATRKFLRQVSSGAPAWDVLAVGDLPAHTHAIADVTGLQTALDGKAASSHTHTIANITGLQTALDAKVAGSGTAGKIAKFSAAQTLADSSISDDGTNVTLTNLLATRCTLGGTVSRQTVHLVKPGNDAGPGKWYIRLAASNAANSISLRVRLCGNFVYVCALGFLEADYGFHLNADGSFNASRDFRVTAASSYALTNLRIGDAVVENGYLSIPVWASNTVDVYATLEWNSSASLAPAATAWVTEALPTANIQAIQGGLNVTGAVTVSTLAGAGSRVPICSANGALSGLANGSDGQRLALISGVPTWAATAISDVNGLQTALDGKAASSHTHAISAVTGLQTALDLKADRASLHAPSALYFDGATANTRIYATLTGQTIGTGDFSLRVKFRVPAANPSVDCGVVGLSSNSGSGGGVRSVAGIINTSGLFYFSIYGDPASNVRNAVMVGNLVTTYGGQVVEVVFTRSGTTIALYINGASVSLSETTSGTPPDWSNQVDGTYLLVGIRNSSQMFRGEVLAASVFNLALSASDALDIFRNGIPSKYQWGSTAEKITAQTDRDFSVSSGNWEPRRVTAVRDAVNNELDVTVTDISLTPYVYLGSGYVTGGAISTGKTYRFGYTIRNANLAGGTLSSALGATTPSAQNIRSSLTNGSYTDTLTVTAAGVWGFYIQLTGGAVGGSFSLDDVSIVQVGAIVDLDFEHADPALSATIADRSNNALHGTIVGGISQTRWVPQFNVGTLVTSAGTLTALLAGKSDVGHHHVPGDTTGPGQFDADLIPNLDASKITGGSLGASVTIGSKTICRKVQIAIPVGTTTLALTHNLGTSDLVVMIRPTTGPYWLTDFEPTSANQVTVSFGTATTEAMTAVILG